MQKIVFVLTENIKFDGRVKKEINTLRKKNVEVHLIVDRFEDDSYSNYDFDIHVVKNLKFNTNNTILNLVSNFSFNIRAAKLIRQLKPNYIHCNDLNTLLSGVLSKKDNELIYDAHELYVEKKKGFSKKVWSVLERFIIKRVDKVIVPEENRLEYLKRKYTNIKEFFLVENFPLRNEDLIDNYFEEYNMPSNKKIISYIGNISKERGIDEIIKAIEDIYDVVFVCVGPIDDSYLNELRQLIEERNLSDRVYFLDAIKNEDVIHATKSSDIGVVFYANTNLNNYYCASNKLYEYLTCKIPVITNDYPGLLNVINKTNSGVNISELSAEQIKSAITLIKESHFSYDGYENYYWENQEKTLYEIYKIY